MIDGTSGPLANWYGAISSRLIPTIPLGDPIPSRRGGRRECDGSKNTRAHPSAETTSSPRRGEEREGKRPGKKGGRKSSRSPRWWWSGFVDFLGALGIFAVELSVPRPRPRPAR